MSRSEQLAALQSAEACLEARRRTFMEQRQARIEALRRVHPGLLLCGGMLAGVVAECIARRLVRSTSLPIAGLNVGLRLLRLIPGGALASLLGPDA